MNFVTLSLPYPASISQLAEELACLLCPDIPFEEEILTHSDVKLLHTFYTEYIRDILFHAFVLVKVLKIYLKENHQSGAPAMTLID